MQVTPAPRGLLTFGIIIIIVSSSGSGSKAPWVTDVWLLLSSLTNFGPSPPPKTNLL